MKLFQLIAISVSSLLLFISVAYANQSSIAFSNAGGQVILMPVSDGQYRVTQNDKTGQKGHLVSLSGSLIAKVNKQLSKVQIKHFHPAISNVSTLFELQNDSYFLLELIDDSNLSEVLTALQQHKIIKQIQPDILQLRDKSEQKTASNKPSKRNKSQSDAPYIKQFAIERLWNRSKGKGIKVAIIDDGFDLAHPDLLHVKQAFSYDAQSRSLSYLPHDKIDSHGTKVAGIIFAAHDSIGINGIAPEAELIALRQPDTWTSNTLLSFQLAKLAGADIINCSWHSRWLLQPIVEAVNDLAEHGRDGKGVAVVFAAGNQGINILPNSTESAIESAIVVGASDQNGLRLTFSNYGPSVDIQAFGRSSLTTLPEGKYGGFSGTSLASAVISGVAALLLATNPDMNLSQLLQALKNMIQTHETNQLQEVMNAHQ